MTGILLFFSLLFLVSLVLEPRAYRNAIFFMLVLMAGFLNLVFLLLQGRGNLSVIAGLASLFLLLPLVYLAYAIYFIVAGCIALKREGLHLSQTLSLLFGLGMLLPIGIVAGFSLQVDNPAGTSYPLVIFFSFCFFLAGYVLFGFFAFYFFSKLYLLLPRRKDYNYVIVHGAGLLGGDRVSPLLKGRLDKGLKAYYNASNPCKIIVSGGQGSDESISEAEAMKRYLLSQLVPEEDIILEDKSTTTYENLKYAKALMDALSARYTCVFVTSDYHVFRTSIYAKKLGLSALGLGSKTASYYRPNAMIREYIAIIVKHKLLPLLFLGLWILFALLVLLFR